MESSHAFRKRDRGRPPPGNHSAGGTDPDGLSGARGIALAVALALVLYAVLALTAYLLIL